MVARGAHHRAIWVYKDERELVASCPAPGAVDAARAVVAQRAPHCQVTGDTLELTLALPARGAYAVVTLGGASSLPTPTGALDADIDAASRIEGGYQIGHLEVDRAAVVRAMCGAPEPDSHRRDSATSNTPVR